MRTLRVVLCSLLFCPAWALQAIPVFAENQATITIEQLSASQYGVWTLLSADGSSVSSAEKGIDVKKYAFTLATFGPAVFSVVPPVGMSAKISVYRGGDLIASVTNQQYALNILNNDSYRFVVQYALTKLGTLGITSDPSGARFRMKGPNGRTYTGVSPKTFKNIPAGTYSILFSTTADCLQPAKKSIAVKPGERNTAHISLPCNTEAEGTVDRSRISKRALRDYVEQRERNPRGERK